MGSISRNNTRSYFSNYGSSLDIFAPGEDILSTWIGSNTATKIHTRTSMATPFVSGLVVYLQALEGLKTPQDVSNRLSQLATKDAVADPGLGSPNMLAFNGATQ